MVPPGGILAQKGEMSLVIVIVSGIAGSLIGALFNYWLAVKLGRPFFLRYGKYLLVSEKKFLKSEEFFRRHGETGTFEFDADRAGVYSYYCSEFCSALHLEMTGYLLVEPESHAAK